MGVGVADGAAVDAPGLAAGPEAVVPVALAGAAALGGAVRVHIKGVVGAAVRPERVGQAGGGVQQGDVQHAVDDKAVIVRIIHGTPGLQEPAAGLVAGQQLVGGGDGGVPGLFAAHQLPGGHAGGAVEEAHVVVVHHHLAGDAVGKAVDLHQGGLFERLAAGGLVGQPDLAARRPARSRRARSRRSTLRWGSRDRCRSRWSGSGTARCTGAGWSPPGGRRRPGPGGLLRRSGRGWGRFSCWTSLLAKKGGAGFNPGPARHCDGDILPGFAAGGGIGSLQGYFNP